MGHLERSGRGGVRRSLLWTATAVVAITAASCSTPTPPTEPVAGQDLAVTVTSARAELGSTATQSVTVSSVGTQTAVGEVTASVVTPPGQSIVDASGSGWTCAVASGGAEATCTNPGGVPAGTQLPLSSAAR